MENSENSLFSPSFIISLFGIVGYAIIFILAFLLIIVNIKKEKNKKASINLIFNYELNIAFILHSISYFYYHNHNNGPNDLDNSICKVQAVVSISTLINIISVVASISAIAYHNFTKPGKIEKYKAGVLFLHYIYAWIAPFVFGLLFNYIQFDKKNVINDGKSDNKYIDNYDHNYLLFCWINDKAITMMIIFYCYYGLGFIIFIFSLWKLRLEVNTFLMKFGKKEEYQQFLDRLKYYYIAIGFTIATFVYNILDLLLEHYKVYSSESKKEIFTTISFLSELILIVIYLIAFSFNSSKIAYFKELFCCQSNKKDEEKRMLEISDMNESEDSLNSSIY